MILKKSPYATATEEGLSHQRLKKWISDFKIIKFLPILEVLTV
jgi:hypothetical protein